MFLVINSYLILFINVFSYLFIFFNLSGNIALHLVVLEPPYVSAVKDLSSRFLGVLDVFPPLRTF